MKKYLISIVPIMYILFFVPLTAMAYNGSYYDGGLYYKAQNGEVTITDCLDSLTKVNIPSSINNCPVTTISAGAFSDCRSLTSITLPSSITSIGGSFSCCSSLTNIEVNANNQYYSSINGNLYSKDKTKLLSYTPGKSNTTFVIPNSVTSIGVNAFSNCINLKNITVPNSVTDIGLSAFSYCKNLTSMAIPDSVTSIGSEAFYNCEHLTSITIPNGVTNVEAFSFGDCSRLTSVTIPYGVESIGGSAFLNCSSLKNIIIPDSVTKIDRLAFSDCGNLTTIVMSNNIASIGEYAFQNCKNLKEVHINDIAKWCCIEFTNFDSNPLYYAHNLYINGEIAANIVIPSNVTTIGKFTFENCKTLVNITLPNSILNIGNSAFSGCTGLTSVTIPNSVTSIGSYAFSGCNNLETVYSTKFAKWSYDFMNGVKVIYGFQVDFIGDYEAIQIVEDNNYATLPTPPTGYTYTYKANGKVWDSSEPITENIAVTVIKTPIMHQVKFIGDYVDEQTVQYNGYATLPAECGYTYSYTANGKDWNNEPITADITITVTKTPITYQVTFIGDYEDTKTVEYGKNAILPAVPKYSKYTFTVKGKPWDGKNITDNVTVNVKLTEFEVSPQYCFNDDGKCYYKFNLKSSNDFDATVIIALYDINGKLLDILSKDASLTNTYQSITAKPSVTDAVEYKVFLWENLQIMTPVCEAFFGNVEN